MNIQKIKNKQGFEEYKIDLMRIRSKYLIESIEIKKRLLTHKGKMIEKDLKPHK